MTAGPLELRARAIADLIEATREMDAMVQALQAQIDRLNGFDAAPVYSAHGSCADAQRLRGGALSAGAQSRLPASPLVASPDGEDRTAAGCKADRPSPGQGALAEPRAKRAGASGIDRRAKDV